MGARSLNREPCGCGSLSPLRASRRCARVHGPRDATARSKQALATGHCKASPPAGYIRHLPIITLEESYNALSAETNHCRACGILAVLGFAVPGLAARDNTTLVQALSAGGFVIVVR